MTTTRLRRAAAAALALVAVVLAGSAYASADDHDGDRSRGHARTIRLVEASAAVQPTFVDVGKPGPSIGDGVVVQDGVRREDGSPAGTLEQECTLITVGATPPASAFECSGSLVLDEGTITMSGPFTPAKPVQAAAITGGTGEFAAARGQVEIEAEADVITVHLIA